MINHAYIHIPFCIRKCKYCSFVSGFDIKLKERYLNALESEIKSRYKKDKLKTLYIGGGTPSLLNPEDLNKIISLFDFEDNSEITLEANPETVELKKFTEFKSAGINRISSGVQTFNEKLLSVIGRKHGEKDIYSAVDTIKSSGFKNISIDLIYGLPSQTIDDVKQDAEKAIRLDINHISTYGLKIEEESYFGKNPPENLPDDEKQAQMYLYLCEFLRNNGFIHYEISNFAKKGFESIHNSAYWQNKNYYGFGLNASGYEEKTRYTNTKSFETYIKNPLTKDFETVLTEKEILEEEIFLALRLKNGINIQNINEKFGIDFVNKYKTILDKYSDFLIVENGKVYLSEKGFLLSNEIMSEFLE